MNRFVAAVAMPDPTLRRISFRIVRRGVRRYSDLSLLRLQVVMAEWLRRQI